MIRSVLRMLKATACAKIRCHIKVQTPVIRSMIVRSKRKSHLAGRKGNIEFDRAQWSCFKTSPSVKLRINQKM